MTRALTLSLKSTHSFPTKMISLSSFFTRDSSSVEDRDSSFAEESGHASLPLSMFVVVAATFRLLSNREEEEKYDLNEAREESLSLLEEVSSL